jgi:hypothetical protein
MTPFSQWLASSGQNDSPEFETFGSAELSEIDAQPDEFAELIALLQVNVEMQEQVRLSARVNELRGDWHKAHVERSKQQLEGDVAELESYLTGAIARTIAPLLGEHILQKAIGEFRDLLKQHIAIEPLATPQISVPADLREPLEMILDDNEIQAVISEATDGEIRARIGSTEFETAIAEWAERLREASLQ